MATRNPALNVRIFLIRFPHVLLTESLLASIGFHYLLPERMPS